MIRCTVMMVMTTSMLAAEMTHYTAATAKTLSVAVVEMIFFMAGMKSMFFKAVMEKIHLRSKLPQPSTVLIQFRITMPVKATI